MKQKKKKKRTKKIKKKINDRLINGRIIRDIKTLFEQQEEKDYSKPKGLNNFWNN